MAKATVIALVLLMASVALTTVPVQAQIIRAAEQPVSGPLPAGVTPAVTIHTTASINIRPNPVGVGQPFLVNIWTTPAPAVNRMQYGYTVTITRPDGTKDTLKMDSQPHDGASWFEYVADQLGTWKLQFSFAGTYHPAGRYFDGYIVTANSTVIDPEQSFRQPNTYDSVYYEPSSTPEQTLTVQQELVSSWPPSPLPTDYWTRPVTAGFREWSAIMGDYPWTGHGGGANWPANTNTYASNYEFVPYSQAPNTAHVVWKRIGTLTGLIGAGFGQQSIGGSPGGVQTLPTPGSPTIVYAGRCYQTIAKPFNGVTQSVWECYDLRTGEVYWDLANITRVPTFIEYEGGTPVVLGGAAAQAMVTVSLGYIGGGVMTKYNPFTGAVNYNISIAPLTSGEYYVNDYALSVQNLGSSVPLAQRYRLINWTTKTNVARGISPTFAQRIESNITWPWSSLPSIVDYEAGVAVQVSSITISGAYAGISLSGASLKTGAWLWNATTTEPIYSGSCVVADHGKVAVLTGFGHWLAYDLYSGKLAWTGELMDYPWGSSGFGAYAAQSAYGLFFWEAYDGVYAYDWDTGKIAWHFHALAPYPYESYYQDGNDTVYPFDQDAIVADGKLYTYNIEHSAISPITRGWQVYCLNATTGERIWNVTTPGPAGPISDGYMAVGSVYDGYMYVFGKGKSKTTVEAPLTAITQGQSVVLTGTVLDQSPAQPDAACVSKESMTTYMEYLHIQKPIPSGVTVTGIPVSLDAVDPNGNTEHIATVTSDISGVFSCLWKPALVGKYTVTATFMGDDSYGSSFAETAVGVVEAPASPTPEQPPAPADYTMTIIVTGIAIIIAVAIAVAIAVMLLRKR
jgi:hypothetical protein